MALSPNNEINGLTLGGVGRGTSIDYVQVSYSNDDSFEWFGGTVNAKHLIAYRGIDDDFDTDFGFSGRVQFGIGLRDPLVADVSGSKGYKKRNYGGNDAQGSKNREKRRNCLIHETFRLRCSSRYFTGIATDVHKIRLKQSAAIHIVRKVRTDRIAEPRVRPQKQQACPSCHQCGTCKGNRHRKNHLLRCSRCNCWHRSH